MPEMTNPMDALVSLQAALDAGSVRLRQCDIHRDLWVIVDEPNGILRITYASVVDRVVQSIAIFALTEPVDGTSCFGLGYAVIESMRGQGLATKIVSKGMDELRSGLSRNGKKRLYIEAVVATSNLPSNRLAARLLSQSPVGGTDAISGQPVLQYLKLIDEVAWG